MGQMVNIVQNKVMRITALFFLIFIGNFIFSPVVAQDLYVLVIHGGACTILKSQSTPEQEKRYKESLEQALHAGQLVLQQISALKPQRIVYVACDPAALARDCAFANDLGWQLTKVRAFDLFPMTHHIEMVALFTRSAID